MQLPMSKIQIIGIYHQLDETLTALQEFGAVELEDASSGGAAPAHLPPDLAAGEERELLGYLLVQLDSLLTALPPSSAPGASAPQPQITDAPPMSTTNIRSTVEEVATQMKALTRQRDELEAERQSLPRYEATIRRLIPLAGEIPQLTRFEIVALLIDRHFAHIIENLRIELESLTDNQVQITSGIIDEQTLGAILVFPPHFSAAVHGFLGQEQINQLRLPDDLVDVPLHEALSAMQTRKSEIGDSIAMLDAQLSETAINWRETLVHWRFLIRDRLAALQARGLLGATRSTFVICGWIPDSALPDLKALLNAKIGDEVFVTETSLTPADRDQAPVVLRNPSAVEPFEMLIRLLSLPRYATLDPSMLMAFFMPLIFGMILGDVAYGAVTIAIGFWLQRRYSSSTVLHDLGRILMAGGVWAVMFGFLYGEFLGTLGEALGLHPLLDRAHALVPLFVTALAMGIVQVVLGLLLGAWIAIREHHLGHLSEKAGALISLCGIFALIAVATDLLPTHFFTPVLVTIVLGIILLSAPMGLIGLLLGPLELLGTVGNILSYLRIAAIGLSSVYLAEVANEMAGLAGNMAVGIVVAGLFHALNIALGIVSPTIQSLRLQYVEFFGKFYEGGGRPFRPFKRENGDDRPEPNRLEVGAPDMRAG